MQFSYSTFQQTKNKIIEEYQKSVEFLRVQNYDSNEIKIDQYKYILDGIIQRKNKSQQRLKCLKSQQKKYGQSITQQNSKQNINTDHIFITDTKMSQINHINSLQSRRSIGHESELQLLQNKKNKIGIEIASRTKLQQKINQLENCSMTLKKQIQGAKFQLDKRQTRSSQIQQITQQAKCSYMNLRNQNRNVKRYVSNTTRIFVMNLHGRKQNRINTNRKNLLNLDQLAQNVIKIDKLKQILLQQIQVMNKYSQQEKQKQQKLKNYHQLDLKYHQILLIYSFIQQIKDNKNGTLKQIIQKYRTKNDNTQVQCNNLTKVVIDFYRQLKSQDVRLKNLYFISLSEVQEKKSDLEKIIQMSKAAQKQRNAFIQENKSMSNGIIQLIGNSTLLTYQKKIEHIGTNILQFYDRILFFLRRQMTSLKRIIQNWLKFDKSASNFIKQLEFEVDQLLQNTDQSLSLSESKHYLVNSFQKWQNYLFFLQAIHKNPFIYRYLTKQLLNNHLRRIIKTKINHPEFSTERLFMASISQIQDESQLRYRDRIKKIINILDKINKYAAKFQVLIVNIKENQQKNKEEKQNDNNLKYQRQPQINCKATLNENNQSNDLKMILKRDYKNKKETNYDFNLHTSLQKQFNKVSKII